MLKRFQYKHKHTSLDFLFILILLCVFAFTSLTFVFFGANIYKDITEKMDRNFALRTPISYITTKVRQYDAQDAVWLTQKDGIPVLVLETDDNSQICQTWIYEYNDHLCEVYVDKGSDLALSNGMEMIPSYGLDLSMTDNSLLHITSYDENGKSIATSISLRSTQTESGE